MTPAGPPAEEQGSEAMKLHVARGACVYLAATAVGATAAFGGAPAGSRAAWWLHRDGVRPVADLVNQARPGQEPAFRDRLGRFEVAAKPRALLLTGEFAKATLWRFDLSTFDGQFDMRRLYAAWGTAAFPDANAVHTRRLATFLGDPAKALTHTGPWEVFNGDWLVPTARVALDGEHVYTLWFGLPSLEDQDAGRVYATFALEIDRPGRHAVRIAFDDFPRHTRWRPTRRQPVRPEVTYTRNVLRPGHVGSIAVGEDERVALLEDIRLKDELVGKHPRLGGSVEAVPGGELGPDAPEVRKLVTFLDPDQGERWEYSDDAESMASGNDMDAGRKGLSACRTYDRLRPQLTTEARRQVDRAFRKRFAGIYRFFVFQRGYHPTGYAQNHSSKSVWALVGAGLAWDGPEAGKWLRMATMVCRQRVELLGRDGSLEWLNEGRHYGLEFWETSRTLLRDCTGVDLARGPFFRNEWRYALHNAPAFPAGPDRAAVMIAQDGQERRVNRPVPAGATPENTPTDFHFDDCDQVFMRSGWGPGDLRLRFTAGSVFGKHGTPRANRYNWAHCQVNRGSIELSRGRRAIVNEPGRDRTYRKGAGSNNCLLVNDTDQWSGGQVWHARLGLEQVGRIALFADGRMLSVARADLAGAYPPAARVAALSRVVVHLKPDHFLVFDRLETHGEGKGEWRFHAAFIESLGGARFGLHGAVRKPLPKRQKPASYDEAFGRDPVARCEAAFLAPPVTPAVGMSDVYFRWGGFRQPTRHLRIVQAGEGPMSLLAAFAPSVALSPRRRGVFAATRGDVRWSVLVGPATEGPLRSDAHLAVLAENTKKRHAEVYRFGGRRVALNGQAISDQALDTFVTFRNGQRVRTHPQ